MINREWQTVKVITFATGLDEHGQIRQLGSSNVDEEMIVKPYNQSNSNNPIFLEVTLVALTKNHLINTENQIEIDNRRYNILYVIPSKKYSILMLKRV